MNGWIDIIPYNFGIGDGERGRGVVRGKRGPKKMPVMTVPVMDTKEPRTPLMM